MKPPVQTKPAGSPRILIVALLLLAAAALAGIFYATSRMTTPAVDLGYAPEFALTAQDGSTVTGRDLLGEVWVADFFFTRCMGICPTLTARMLDVQEGLQGRTGWKLVSITVDPEYDTPEVLAAYADEKGADPARWTFLTGEKDVVHTLIKTGFLLPVQKAEPGAPEPILHSSRFVLIDGEGAFRGFYDALDEASVADLIEDARALVDAGGS